MGRIHVSRDLPGRVVDAERLWYDTSRWPSFVDGFGHVTKLEDGWPARGRVVWSSHPGGRGLVSEHVSEYVVRSHQTVEIEEERMLGTQTISFAPLDDGCRIELELDYGLKSAGPAGALVDLFFVRRALRDSIVRTLVRFARELEVEVELSSID
jgi:hypothetical protein